MSFVTSTFVFPPPAFPAVTGATLTRITHAVSPQKYSPTTLGLPWPTLVLRHLMLLTSPQIFNRIQNLRLVPEYPACERRYALVRHSRLLSDARSRPPPRRRPPAPERSNSVHARHQTKDLNALREKNRERSLAEKILRPHSAQQRRAGRRSLVHLDEPSSREHLPTSREISVLRLPHREMAANAPTGCRVASPLAPTPNRPRKSGAATQALTPNPPTDCRLPM